MWKNGHGAHYYRHVLSGLGRSACLSSSAYSTELPLAHLVAFHHAIFRSISGRDGIYHFRSSSTSTASPRKSLHTFHHRRPTIAELLRAGARCYEINSATRDFSSFNSATDASIFARLKSFIGRPCTISHFLPRTRTGKDEINPFSTS